MTFRSVRRIALTTFLMVLFGAYSSAQSQSAPAHVHQKDSTHSQDWPVYGGQAAGDHATVGDFELDRPEYGKVSLEIPLGEYPKLAAQGFTNSGSENYGGPILTASNVLFRGAAQALF